MLNKLLNNKYIGYIVTFAGIVLLGVPPAETEDNESTRLK
ncbi:Uncharacterised protein [Providencia heimbachae]|uniref:Uncharacterized protein n=1 Tax=Providencia heimbachae ATCC 35613 TaxID=1354272 RepID=A0A1B7JHV7_9GAMM|nr:hypothetical protein M998_3691 [Providencia heimbachae ATCC 35613]SQH12901.1 Uncharacterised protein [Providencia heimbachae]